MSFESLGLALALIAIVGLWIAAPILNRNLRKLSTGMVVERGRDRLLSHYERLLNNIRDLDEDFATGKITEADHEFEREKLVQQGIAVLKEIDTVAEHVAAPSEYQIDSDLDAAVDSRLDQQIEQAIKSRRKGGSMAPRVR